MSIDKPFRSIDNSTFFVNFVSCTPNLEVALQLVVVMMARNAVFSRRRWPEEVEEFDLSRSEGGGAHVLAVDDSLVDRKVIERLLKISSCKVTAVDSGRSALQFLGLDEEDQKISALERLKVDLIITDYSMPGMTGYDLLKKIKESSAFKEVPVVIMSSENVLARIDRCLEEGAEDFIVKPVKLSDVKRLKDRTLISNKRKLPDGSDRSASSTSSESPPSTASPGSSPSISQSPAFTPSPPSSSQSSQPALPERSEPLDSPSRRLKPLMGLDLTIPVSPL